MPKQEKFYVVWSGKTPGVYSQWTECKVQIEGFENAKYKSFESFEDAQKAFVVGWKYFYKKNEAAKPSKGEHRPDGDFIAVDAACSGNPGKMEYRGVFRESTREIFHQGPFEEGTNNIGEFLAIVHALALQTNKNSRLPIYSDSMSALIWIKKKKCGTKLLQTTTNEPIFDLIDRAETWLQTHNWNIPVLKWNTSLWGEIPADFGRK